MITRTELSIVVVRQKSPCVIFLIVGCMIEIANHKWIRCMAVINSNMDFIILPVGNINLFIFWKYLFVQFLNMQHYVQPMLPNNYTYLRYIEIIIVKFSCQYLIVTYTITLHVTTLLIKLEIMNLKENPYILIPQ